MACEECLRAFFNTWDDLEKGHLPCGITNIKTAAALNKTHD